MVEQTLQKNAAFGVKSTSSSKTQEGSTVDVDFDLV